MRKHADFATVHDAQKFREALLEEGGQYGPHEDITLVERVGAALMEHEKAKPYQVSWIEWVD